MHVGLRFGGILNVRSKVTQISHSCSFTPHTLSARLSSAPSSIVPKVLRAFSPHLFLLRKLTTYQFFAAPNSTQTFSRTLRTVQKMESNGSIRNKRKKSPIAHDRPTKQLKPGTSGLINGDGTPEEVPLYGAESDGEESHHLPLAVATADTAEWQATIEKVVRNVVSIHFCQVAPFDTDSAISSEATGFVVDAERGYILTNRYVCGEALEGFANHFLAVMS